MATLATDRRADVVMRRLLRIPSADTRAASAHAPFRFALVLTAIRCTISYVLVPVLVPVVSFAGLVAAPLSIALCVFAVINGVVSIRRFWMADHRFKWHYTVAMTLVFVILAVALTVDIASLVAS